MNELLNKITQGDCLEVIRELPAGSVDLIVTDPPYVNVVAADWDKENPFTDELMVEFLRICKPNASIYVWCGIGEKSRSLVDFIPKLDRHFHFKDLITWKKQRGIGMRKGWLYTREECLWYVKDNKQFTWNKAEQYSDEGRKNPKGFNGKPTLSDKKRFTNVWTDITEESFNTSSKELSSAKRQHLTPKPVKAIERIIKLHTAEGDVVLDCFLGSGTTAVAAINTNRQFIGIERETEYVEIGNRRIEEALKRKEE